MSADKPQSINGIDANADLDKPLPGSLFTKRDLVQIEAAMMAAESPQKEHPLEPEYDGSHMDAALREASAGVAHGEGGPFGAVIVRRGTVISRGHNRVLQTNDPTAHAEVIAIRDACAKLGTWSLHDCVIYSTCQPCPMCFSAIHWAKIKVCYYAATADDAANVGFDDRFLYDALQEKTQHKKCNFVRVAHNDALAPMKEYRKKVDDGSLSLY